MKTEKQIAEVNIKNIDKTDTLVGNHVANQFCEDHKASCERDVPKLKKIKESVVYVENELVHHLIDEMIQDKEQAIKLYNEVGI